MKTEKQKELDLAKWLDSEKAGCDTCGSYAYCVNCDKSLENPCVEAIEKTAAPAPKAKRTCAKKATTTTAKKTTTKAAATKTTAKKTTAKRTTKYDA